MIYWYKCPNKLLLTSHLIHFQLVSDKDILFISVKIENPQIKDCDLMDLITWKVITAEIFDGSFTLYEILKGTKLHANLSHHRNPLGCPIWIIDA